MNANKREAWNSLANLMGLNLFSSQLSGEIPPELDNFTSLTSLLVNNNQLSFLPGGGLQFCPWGPGGPGPQPGGNEPRSAPGLPMIALTVGRQR